MWSIVFSRVQGLSSEKSVLCGVCSISLCSRVLQAKIRAARCTNLNHPLRPQFYGFGSGKKVAWFNL